MSLRGTLGDFGIADIFQLIGHQAKTGVLNLKDLEVEVRIYFVDGNVVKAEQNSHEKTFLLGSIMVRANVLTQAQLDDALSSQQRTLRRLGDILIDMGAVDRPTLKEFTRLQTTETIYRLFQWRAGTYEFNAEAVDYDDASDEPIRSENILMEALRMVDEWPGVRTVISSSSCTFVVLRALPPAPAAEGANDDILAGMKEAFGPADSGEQPPAKTAKPIGTAERQVFPHVHPGRTVSEIVDRARMGEFETSKALANLVMNGNLRVLEPESVAVSTRPAVTRESMAAAAVPFLLRILVFLGVAVVVGGLVRLASSLEGGLLSVQTPRATRAALVDEQGEAGLLRLRSALELYRVQEGRYPEQLAELVTGGFIDERGLSFPFRATYAYRRTTSDVADAGVGEEGFDLVMPLR